MRLRFQLPSRALVKRELLSNLRRVPSFLCLVLFVGFCTFVVVAMWPLTLRWSERFRAH